MCRCLSGLWITFVPAEENGHSYVRAFRHWMSFLDFAQSRILRSEVISLRRVTMAVAVIS